MRRLSFIVIVLMVAAVAWTQTFVPGHDNLLWEWDAVTDDINGQPLPSDWVITYELCRAAYPPSDLTACPNQGTSADTVSGPDFLPDGVWTLGTRALATLPDGTQRRSAIAWSHVAGVPDPWVIGIPVVIGDPRVPANVRVRSHD